MKLNSTIGKIGLLFIFSILFFSCVSKKKMTYLQGGESIELSKVDYSVRFTKDDILTIIVSALDQEAAQLFNGDILSRRNGGGGSGGKCGRYLGGGFRQQPHCRVREL